MMNKSDISFLKHHSCRPLNTFWSIQGLSWQSFSVD